MEITRVHASAQEVEAEPLLGGEAQSIPFAFVEIETDDGITGFGESAFFPAGATARHVNEMASRLEGENPLATERIRNLLLRDERVPLGMQSAAVSMVDIALWDIRGKALDEPVWRLLGGVDREVPVYLTLGSVGDDEEAVIPAARDVVENWGPRLKMVVGHSDGATPRNDAARVAAVREAIGHEPALALDANASYGSNDAIALANSVADHDIAWFEEPIYRNDVTKLRDLRQRSTLPITAGQFSTDRSQHWELVDRGAVDLVQPNVCCVGGYTEGRKVASMAETANTDLAHAGGWPFQNMHLIGGTANGWVLEVHDLSWAIGERVYQETPTIEDGTIELPDRPGLGLEPNWDVLS